ncbi:MAG TPA: hypothetical protein VNJ28_08750 [Candidatus Limnocylindrales bacterium]|nr:hypothetical protein [Candidatus Limnocylindrales bacterium]
MRPEAVIRALSEAGRWLGSPVEPADLPAGWRRFLADMKLPIGDGRLLTFAKSAFVDVGPVGPRSVEISWRAASLQPLFPVFAGRLEIREGRLRLEGRYAPPGGALGRIADALLLHTAARGTATWLLGEISRAAGDS